MTNLGVNIDHVATIRNARGEVHPYPFLAAKNDYVLFLQHDHLHECCTVKLTERGVKLDKTFKLKEII